MASKHTPGPWTYYADLPSAEPNWHIVTTENRLRILANVYIEPGNAMDEANARLITAAPDLLEALEWALAELRGDTRYETPDQRARCFDRADAAIVLSRIPDIQIKGAA